METLLIVPSSLFGASIAIATLGRYKDVMKNTPKIIVKTYYKIAKILLYGSIFLTILALLWDNSKKKIKN